jgi:hypothetical protein
MEPGKDGSEREQNLNEQMGAEHQIEIAYQQTVVSMLVK